jgi:hypothetical protein
MWSKSRRLFHSEIKIVHSGKLSESVPISKFEIRTKAMNIIVLLRKPQFMIGGERDWIALKVSSVRVVLGYYLLTCKGVGEDM